MRNSESRWIEKEIRESAVRGNEAVNSPNLNRLYYENGFGDALGKVLDYVNQRPKAKAIPQKPEAKQ